MSRTHRPFARAILACVLLALVLVPATPSARVMAAGHRRKIVVGALLSLTGGWSSLGNASEVALEIAVRRMNEEFTATGSPTRVELIVEDTKLDPTLAVEKFESLAARKVDVVVGPQSSAELRAVKPMADAKGIVVVSQGSTASSLAFAGDAVFRFCPSDVHEGEAIAALMRDDGADTVVPVWRGDAGNDGLEASTRSSFVALGGSVADGVRYDATTTDFAAQVAALADQVRAAKAAGETPAVYLASFDEGIEILDLASADADLASVRWYAGDGLTQSETLLADPVAAAFAAAVGFTAPNVGLDPAARDIYGPLSDEIQSRVGYAPDAYALAAYDAAWVGVLARQAVKGKSLTKLEAAFVGNANRYWGATGATQLDAAGDRRTGNYDFWRVSAADATYGWNRSAAYVNGAVVPPIE